MKTIVGWCLAQFGWAASLVFRLVDWVLYQEIPYQKSFYDCTPEKPFPGPVINPKPLTQRIESAEDMSAQRSVWAERMQWQERVYEDIDELVPYVREGDPR